MKNLKESMKAGLILMAVGAGLLAYSSDVDSVKAGDTPPLISAILQEDKELYSKEMSRLLNQPMAEFKEAVSFKTEQGDNIFHLMARVRSNQAQSFFAKEMRTLTFLADLGSRLEWPKDEKKNLSLGGVNIEIPYLEDTELGQAIYSRDVSTVVSIANQLSQMPAIKIFQYSHAKTKEERSLKKLTFSHMDMSDLLYFRYKNVEKKIRKYTIPFFYDKANQKGRFPKDIAFVEDNFPAYRALPDMGHFSTTDELIILTNGFMGTMVGTLIIGQLLVYKAGYFGTLEGMFSLLLVGIATGGLASGACYKLFEKKAMKKPMP